MKKEQRVEITLKSERSISIKSSRALTALCEACGREVQMFTPGQAAIICGLSSREVYHRVESGAVHFTETVEGLLLVCLESLLGYQPERNELVIDMPDSDKPAHQLQESGSSSESDNE